MRRFFYALLIVTLFPAGVMAADSTVNKFIIRSANSALSGSEEYAINKKSDGFVLTGKTHLEIGHRTIEFAHTTRLAADWSLVRYDLQVNANGQAQSVEAWRDGALIRMKASGGSESMDKNAPFTPATVVLDNLVVGHYAVLVEQVLRAPGQTFDVLVPQRLALLNTQPAAAGEEVATLGGKPARVRKYTMELSQMPIEFWIDAGSHELMRVSVPLQQIEMLREGFEPAKKEAAAPSQTEPYLERELKLSSGKFQLPAKLCLPKKLAGKAPLVVLVHGSGPHDADETIGPNKPFRDIAHALADSGVATLRYAKRTYAFAAEIDPLNFSLDDEVTDDALAALNYAATLPEVDASRLFVLGHSLGGSMAPYIAQRYGKLRGLILLAAGARPIDQILADQGRMAMEEQGKTQAEIEATLAQQKKALAQLRSGESKEPHGGISAAYWRDWLLREPAVKLKELKLPVLVLQGGKDVQVSSADYELLKTTLAGRTGAAHEEHLFPELNHLFIPAKTGKVAEYATAGQVDARVTDAIAAWVKKQ